MPHAALAVGLAFLLAPSGWLVRLASPELTGWSRPPDLPLVQDPQGLALLLGLVVKEVPFLLLAIGAALGQTRAPARLATARAMGYGPVAAWLKAVLPLVWPQLRLPVVAVLAYSLSNVDMALVLGPTTPPPLAALVLRWSTDPDSTVRARAAAGASLQLAIAVAAVGGGRAAELALAGPVRAWLERGGRGGRGRAARAAAGGALALLAALAGGALAVLAVWSVAGPWRFPDALPAAWTFANLERAAGTAGPALRTTLAVAAATTAVGLAAAALCLEAEARGRARTAPLLRAALALPLLLPQLGLLVGFQVVLVAGGADGTFGAVVAAHLLYVLPYIYLALRGPWLALDPRYDLQARCLGRTALAAFVRVKLPLLLRPIGVAAAVGFAVSIGQYLPTLLAGAGRFATVTTEAVTIATGADRRTGAIYALVQALLPLLGFVLATAVPALAFRNRRAMRVR